MNKLILSIVAIVAISAVSFNAAAAKKYVFVSMDNSLETKTCLAAGNDEKGKLKQHIKHFPNQSNMIISVRQIANSLYCNNMLVANFAKKYNAHNTYAYLNRFTSLKNRIQTHTVIEDITANNYLPDETVYVYVSSY